MNKINKSQWVIPLRFFNLSFDGNVYPGSKKALKLRNKSNCQVFIYEILRANGINISNFRSGQLWDDKTETKKVKQLRPFDIVMFNKNKEAYAAHVGLYIGRDKIIHLSKKIGHPVIWTMKDFLKTKRYKYFIGAKRLKNV